jgi:biotin transport system substrate-specific component
VVSSARLLRVPPVERGLTLGDFLVPIPVSEHISARVRNLMLVGIGTLLIILGARISFYLPGNPVVPVTLQTFGVIFTGALLGFRRGTAAAVLYLALGAVGLPVFAWDADLGVYRSGLATIATWSDGHLVLGVTGGYIVGFVLAAAVVGRLAELGWDRRFGGALAAMVCGEAIIFALGVGWLKVALDVPVATALDYGLWPFLLGDALKVVLAAAVLPFGWWLVNRRPSDR